MPFVQECGRRPPDFLPGPRPAAWSQAVFADHPAGGRCLHPLGDESSSQVISAVGHLSGIEAFGIERRIRSTG